MNANDFRTLIVRPCVDEFLAEPDSFQRAACATWALDAYASHIFMEVAEARPYPSDGAYKNKVLNINLDFQRVFEMAKALKHGHLNDHNPTTRNSGDLKFGDLQGWSWYFSGAEAPGEQFYVHTSGYIFRYYSEAVPRALDFLDHKLEAG